MQTTRRRLSFLSLFCCTLLVGFITGFLAETARGEGDPPRIENLSQALNALEKKADRMIRECRREMSDGTAAYPPQVGIGYAAFWLRDYAYILEGCVDNIPAVELRGALRVFLDAQREDGACVDCVKYDGTPIYKPGYGSMGENPVADGSQFTVAVVYLAWKRLEDDSILDTKTLERLEKALSVVPKNPESGLVFIDPAKDWDRCPYGFHDTVRKQGDVFFESVLYVEAADRLAEMFRAVKRPDDAARFKEDAARMSRKINEVFWDENLSLYRAATVRCREGDIWGSALAVCTGVAPADRADKIAAYFSDNYDGLVFQGQVRMLPPGQYWEQGCGRDSYQNGAFWGTGTGWFALTLRRADPRKAEQMLIDLANAYQKTDCPEWVFGETIRLPRYMSSVTLPIAAMRILKNKPEPRP